MPQLLAYRDVGHNYYNLTFLWQGNNNTAPIYSVKGFEFELSAWSVRTVIELLTDQLKRCDSIDLFYIVAALSTQNLKCLYSSIV